MKKFTNISRFIIGHYLPRLTSCFILIAVVQFSVTGQTPDIKVSGKITAGSGEPLPGVSIGVKNTTKMTTSDANGDFALVAPDNAVLVITYVGFQMQEVSVAGKTQLLITLEAAPNTLGDVVVVGYCS